MIHAGVDAGSVNTKVLLFDSAVRRIVCTRTEPTGLKPRETAARLFDRCLADDWMSGEQVATVTATGYARHTVDFATGSVTEISAAAAGILFWHPTCRTIVDIGGQDSKVIALENGAVLEFAMNDRCAAGTGNFLAVLSRSLNLPLASFGEISLESSRPAPISSLCVVMAESEILSLAAADTPVADILAGLHEALARRIAALAARIRVVPPVVFTGGVAQNPGMVRALAKALGVEVTVCQQPLYAAALGATLVQRK